MHWLPFGGCMTMNRLLPVLLLVASAATMQGALMSAGTNCIEFAVEPDPHNAHFSVDLSDAPDRIQAEVGPAGSVSITSRLGGEVSCGA